MIKYIVFQEIIGTTKYYYNAEMNIWKWTRFPWNDLWLDKLFCHRLDFINSENQAKRNLVSLRPLELKYAQWPQTASHNFKLYHKHIIHIHSRGAVHLQYGNNKLQRRVEHFFLQLDEKMNKCPHLSLHEGTPCWMHCDQVNFCCNVLILHS